MGLKKYQTMRNFQKTAEPKGNVAHSHEGNLVFVIQKHDASHLHYDFRLEVDGVLKSWAIPKGPSLNPADKRLAVQVEDHPFDYRTFEGSISEGSYGAGEVIVWDQGTYEPVGATSRQEAEKMMLKGLDEGRLSFNLYGHKLQGEYALIRTKSNLSKPQWLLIKKKDAFAQDLDITQDASSVLSEKSLVGRKEKAIKFSKKRVLSKPLPKPEKIDIEKKPMPGFIKPMLATLIEAPFDHPDWLYEIKWDGYRALAAIKKDNIKLYSRSGQLFNKRYPTLVEDLKSIQMEAILDGEIIVLDEEGRPSFQHVQNFQRTQTGKLIYYVFDLLYLEGYDIRHLPLIQRKELLRKLLPNNSIVRFCDHIVKQGEDLFEDVQNHHLEGIIAKSAKSPYHSGRSTNWLKIKTHLQQEVIICGYTEPKGSRQYFGSLLLGVYDHNQQLVYVGHTGSGFDRNKLAEVHAYLLPLVQSECPFLNPPKTKFSVTWVKPELVCEVSFAEWTKDEQMRQAIFIDLREDKHPKEITREKKVSVHEAFQNQSSNIPKPRSHTRPSKPLSTSKVPTDSQLKLTHLDKIYWPQEGYSKGDLIDYYQRISSYILPYLKDRPETLHRYPNGIEGASFYQKGFETVPDWIRTEVVHHEGKDVRYVLVEDQASLLYLVNLGCIGLNPFNARIQSLYQPDYLVIDLDPEDVPFDQVIEVAQVVYRTLQRWKISSFCKTSGATGMHIYIPLGAQYHFKEVSQFAKLIAHVIFRQIPDLTSLERSPSKRQQKVYLDYLQNNYSQTVVAPYSVRAKPGATISMPLKWSEVKPGLSPSDFTIKTALKRLKKVGDLFHPVLEAGIDLRKVLKEIEIE